MPIYKETLSQLALLFSDEEDLKRQRNDLLTAANMPIDWRDKKDASLQELFKTLEKVKEDILSNLVRCPPHHMRHFEKLKEFENEGESSRSVFIMTKFPEQKKELDQQLERVISAVETAIQDSGHIPRIASNKSYHTMLWDNVELFLIGCSRGVAIVERRFRTELNPNVAMEWGWMRAMGKEVLFLIDDELKEIPADWGGLLQHKFCWEEPEEDIQKAITEWLGDRV